jgi:hypothetical protein
VTQVEWGQDSDEVDVKNDDMKNPMEDGADLQKTVEPLRLSSSSSQGKGPAKTRHHPAKDDRKLKIQIPLVPSYHIDNTHKWLGQVSQRAPPLEAEVAGGAGPSSRPSRSCSQRSCPRGEEKK